MSESLTLDDVAALAERVDVECKSALGRDGRGELPDDFWKTHSAMANGEGGVVWLGIQEKPRGHFTVLPEDQGLAPRRDTIHLELVDLGRQFLPFFDDLIPQFLAFAPGFVAFLTVGGEFSPSLTQFAQGSSVQTFVVQR